MNIILRVANKPSNKELFVDDKLKIYSKEEIIALIKKERINNLFLAKRNNKIFIKTRPNTKTIDNISNQSISSNELFSLYKNYINATSNKKIKLYDDLRRKQQLKQKVLVRDDQGDFFSTRTYDDVGAHLKKFKGLVREAAQKQKIDKYILGAILIDEFCRKGWDDWLDWLGALDIKNTSIGIAQIKISTAREIIKKQYYNPAPGKLDDKSTSLLISFYLYQPKHSVQFAAAAIKLSIDYWQKKRIDTSKQPKILAYLYSAGYARDLKEAETKRCLQVSTEFYQIARSTLK
ncbi:DUF1402 family protein [Candidatus Saganbacteria bacterium]|nr:DUF1402 family protein [Candidatus Saganbacteria bacterium]